MSVFVKPISSFETVTLLDITSPMLKQYFKIIGLVTLV